MPADKSYFFSWSKQQGNSFFDLKNVGNFTLESEYGELLDLTSLSYQANFGLKNTQIQEAIKKQIDSLPIASTKAHFELKEFVSSELVKRIAPGKIFYTLSGAESVENALKIARKLKQNPKIASLERSYHGASLGALSVGGDWRSPAAEYLYDQNTIRLPSSSGDQCDQRLREFFENLKAPLAAVIIETVTGGNGCYPHDLKWLQVLNEYQEKLGFFLILDEVICGFGRMGSMWGMDHFRPLKPDMICLSKGITGGFIPFGAVWIKTDLAKSFDHEVLPCGLTNYAHPLGLAATKAVLNILEPSFFDQLRDNISFFEKKLQSLQKYSEIKEVRSFGMLAAIELNSPIKIEDCWKQGLSLILTNAGQRIMLAPALSMPKDLLESGLERLEKLISLREQS